MTELGIDTSLAVPLLHEAHGDHGLALEWVGARTVALCGHALNETYSVLTRLPGDARLESADAARLIGERLGEPLLLGPDLARRVPALLADRGIRGGSVYDALVGLAAVDNDAVLATRDERARSTYEAVGARVVVAA